MIRKASVKMPPWSDAPEWAEWRAINAHGNIVYFVDTPIDKGNKWSSFGLKMTDDTVTLPAKYWWLSAEKRK